jgi:hypothetical protein
VLNVAFFVADWKYSSDLWWVSTFIILGYCAITQATAHLTLPHTKNGTFSGSQYPCPHFFSRFFSSLVDCSLASSDILPASSPTPGHSKLAPWSANRPGLRVHLPRESETSRILPPSNMGDAWSIKLNVSARATSAVGGAILDFCSFLDNLDCPAVGHGHKNRPAVWLSHTMTLVWG